MCSSDLEDQTSDRTHRAIETGRLRRREVGEEPADPRCEMSIEELPLLLGRNRKNAPG